MNWLLRRRSRLAGFSTPIPVPSGHHPGRRGHNRCSVVTGEIVPTSVLLVLTVFNAVLDRAVKPKPKPGLASLQSMMKNITRVRRDGEAVEVDAEVVPGDIVLMEVGDRVPADGAYLAATLEIKKSSPDWRERRLAERYGIR